MGRENRGGTKAFCVNLHTLQFAIGKAGRVQDPFPGACCGHLAVSRLVIHLAGHLRFGHYIAPLPLASCPCAPRPFIELLNNKNLHKTKFKHRSGHTERIFVAYCRLWLCFSASVCALGIYGKCGIHSGAVSSCLLARSTNSELMEFPE